MKLIYVVMTRRDNMPQKAYIDLKKALEHVETNPAKFVYDQILLDEIDDHPVEMKSIKEVDKKVYDPLHFNDTMPYGKYKGQTIGTIIQSDPEYLQWCINNCNLALDEDCLGLIEASMDK